VKVLDLVCDAHVVEGVVAPHDVPEQVAQVHVQGVDSWLVVQVQTHCTNQGHLIKYKDEKEGPHQSDVT